MDSIKLNFDCEYGSGGYEGFKASWRPSPTTEFILDPSFLNFLRYREMAETSIISYLPEKLDMLISSAREAGYHRQMLGSFLEYFSHPIESLEGTEPSWDRFFMNMDRINPSRITDAHVTEDNPVYSFLVKAFQDHPFYVTLSPITNLLGDTLGKMIEFSRNTGTLIVSKTRELMTMLAETCFILNLPDKLDSLQRNKQKVYELFQFPGGTSFKWFVNGVLTVGSGLLVDPTAGWLTGTVLWTMDP